MPQPWEANPKIHWQTPTTNKSCLSSYALGFRGWQCAPYIPPHGFAICRVLISTSDNLQSHVISWYHSPCCSLWLPSTINSKCKSNLTNECKRVRVDQPIIDRLPTIEHLFICSSYVFHFEWFKMSWECYLKL